MSHSGVGHLSLAPSLDPSQPPVSDYYFLPSGYVHLVMQSKHLLYVAIGVF